MRLIDADKLIDDLGVRDCYKHESREAYDTLMLYEILGTIEDQPTAYDVDKVVEEIEHIEIGRNCRHKCNHYDWSVGACQGICEDYVRGEAIDIVKRGGAE